MRWRKKRNVKQKVQIEKVTTAEQRNLEFASTAITQGRTEENQMHSQIPDSKEGEGVSR